MVFFSGCVSVFLFDFYTTQKNLLISTGYDRYPVTAIDRDRDRGYGDRFGGAGPYGAPQEPVSCLFIRRNYELFISSLLSCGNF